MSRFRYTVVYCAPGDARRIHLSKLSISLAMSCARGLAKNDSKSARVEDETGKVLAWYEPDPFSARGFVRQRAKEDERESTGKRSAALRAKGKT